MKTTLTGLLLVLCLYACGKSGEGLALSGDLERQFERKQFCADLGRTRLAEEIRREQGLTPLVKAEWCFSSKLNTCIYSSVRTLVDSRDDVVLQTRGSIDLLTNRVLLALSPPNDSPEEVAEYNRKREDLFSHCQ